MIIIKGTYSDMETLVCTEVKPKKIAQWFDITFFQGEEGEYESDEEEKIIESILSGTPDLSLINLWLHREKDRIIQEWD
jgi:hypothetical protein